MPIPDLCFAAMMTCIDDSIANITAAYERKGILNNTIIIFSTGKHLLHFVKYLLIYSYQYLIYYPNKVWVEFDTLFFFNVENSIHTQITVDLPLVGETICLFAERKRLYLKVLVFIFTRMVGAGGTLGKWEFSYSTAQILIDLDCIEQSTPKQIC